MARYVAPEAVNLANYPFAVLPVPGEGWEIVFPDIPGVVGFAETWEDIGSEASTILSIWFEGMEEDGHPIPAPSEDWQPIQRKRGDYVLPEIYSSDDAAEMLGVSVRRVQALAQDRKRGTMVGRTWVFTLDDIAAMRPGPAGRPRKAQLAETI